ncbi:F-Box Only Protein 38 [Manis pentadactyla]|nr:F-Box Only Protein 38 [Manis pentadactyla]
MWVLHSPQLTLDTSWGADHRRGVTLGFLKLDPTCQWSEVEQSLESLRLDQQPRDQRRERRVSSSPVRPLECPFRAQAVSSVKSVRPRRPSRERGVACAWLDPSQPP